MASWDWTKGTNAYDAYAGMAQNEILRNSFLTDRVGFGARNSPQIIAPQINYKNASALIGTNADDALYGAWLRGTVGQGEQLTRNSSGWGDDSEIYYTDAKGNRYNQNQVMMQQGDESGNGGGAYLPSNQYGSWGGIRGTATQQNAELVRQALRQIYPNADQATLDNAAASALSKRGQHWNEVVNPNDIVRAIGAELGGLPEQAAAALAASDPKMLERINQITEARNNSDDAGSGITGFLNDIGPLKYLALLAPGGAGLLSGAMGVSGLEQGDPLKAALGAVGAYYGMDTPGFFDAGGAADKIGGLFGDTANFNTGQIGSVNTMTADQNVVDLFDRAGTAGFDNYGNALSAAEQAALNGVTIDGGGNLTPYPDAGLGSGANQFAKYGASGSLTGASIPSMGGGTGLSGTISGLGTASGGLLTPEVLASTGVGYSSLVPGAVAASSLTLPFANAAAGQSALSSGAGTSFLDKALAAAGKDPLNTMRLIQGGAAIGNALFPPKQEEQETFTYSQKPVDMSLLPALQQQAQRDLRYQQFFNMALPQNIWGG